MMFQYIHMSLEEDIIAHLELSRGCALAIPMEFQQANITLLTFSDPASKHLLLSIGTLNQGTTPLSRRTTRRKKLLQ